MKLRRFETEQRFSMKAHIIRTVQKSWNYQRQNDTEMWERNQWEARAWLTLFNQENLESFSSSQVLPSQDIVPHFLWTLKTTRVKQSHVLIHESTWPDLCKHPVCSLTRTPGISARLILSSMKVHLAVESPQWQAWSQRGKIGFSMRVNCFLKEFWKLSFFEGDGFLLGFNPYISPEENQASNGSDEDIKFFDAEITIKVTFLECPCCCWCFWSESGWMSQWKMCLDWARDEGKAKGNAWLFQVWQIYMLTKKVEYDQQHVGKYYKEDWESVFYKYTHDQQTDFQIHWDCGSWADCEKYKGQSQQTYWPFWQR